MKKENVKTIVIVILLMLLIGNIAFVAGKKLNTQTPNDEQQEENKNENPTSEKKTAAYFDFNSFMNSLDSQGKEIYKEFKYEVIYAEMETMFFVDSTNNKLYSTTSRDASELTEYPNIKGRVIDVELVIPGTGERPQFVYLLADGTVKAYYNENDIRDTGLKNIVKLFKITNSISVGRHGKIIGRAMDSDGVLHSY